MEVNGVTLNSDECMTQKVVGSELIPLRYEDLHIGDTWRSETRIISQSEIRDFADLTGDFTPIHIDEDYAATTPFRGTIAHGLLGLSILAGLGTRNPCVETIALVEISGWKFRNPVFVDDEIHSVTEVLELTEHGKKHGLVKWYRRLVNQRGEIVQDGVMSTLVARQVAKRRRFDSAIPAQEAGLHANHLEANILLDGHSSVT